MTSREGWLLMISLGSRLRRKEQVLMQQSSGEVILLNLSSGHYYALNEVGGRVWELYDGTRCVSQVIGVIHQEYDVRADTAEADVLEITGELIGEGLLLESK